MEKLPEWSCQACTSVQQDMRGCERPATIKLIDIGGESLERCPRRLIKEEPEDFGRALGLYSMWEKGVLLREGAYEDQPAAYVELMHVIKSAVSELEADARAEADKAAKRRKK